MPPNSRWSVTASTSPTSAKARCCWRPVSSRLTLFVVIKGHVSQLEGQEAIASYGPSDCFDGRALMAGRASSRFVAAEEVVAYQLAKEAVNALIARNASFGALLFSDLSAQAQRAVAAPRPARDAVLAMSRVDEAFLRPAHVVDGAAGCRGGCVDAGAPYQQRAGARRRAARHLHQYRVAARGRRRPAAGVAGGRRTRHVHAGHHRTRRAAFRRARPNDPAPGAPAGRHPTTAHRRPARAARPAELPVEPFLPDHRTDRAGTGPEALRVQAERITRFVALLYRGGTRVGQIGKLVQALNAKLFERAWQLVAPAELVADSCLFVMGSEGRGEQLLKTDQDNGLILRDGTAVERPMWTRHACASRRRCADFGYPDCPGGIMVSNPAWRRSASDFTASCATGCCGPMRKD